MPIDCADAASAAYKRLERYDMWIQCGGGLHVVSQLGCIPHKGRSIGFPRDTDVAMDIAIIRKGNPRESVDNVGDRACLLAENFARLGCKEPRDGFAILDEHLQADQARSNCDSRRPTHRVDDANDAFGMVGFPKSGHGPCAILCPHRRRPFRAGYK
ncbi:unnamed protein product [Aphanomyces euteiches]